MSDSVCATSRGSLLRAVQTAQAEAILSEVPSAGLGLVNLRFCALAWLEAIRQVLETALSPLGFSAPQAMKRAENTYEAEES